MTKKFPECKNCLKTDYGAANAIRHKLCLDCLADAYEDAMTGGEVVSRLMQIRYLDQAEYQEKRAKAWKEAAELLEVLAGVENWSNTDMAKAGLAITAARALEVERTRLGRRE